MQYHRRGLMAGSIAAFGAALFGTPALAAAPRSLSLLNLHTGEALKATYFEAGDYVPDALKALSRVLRDHRTGETRAMAPNLFDLVAALQQRLETKQTVQIISGYRSPKTNASLNAKSSGVATRSLHMDGKALDIRIPGVPLVKVRDAGLDLKLGGVGYYPSDNFVHVDVGRVRRW